MIIKVCDPRQTKVGAAAGGGGGAAPKRRGDAHLGRSMKGLIRYLVGPGENNEHTNPTLVAASGTLGPEWSDAIWDDPLWGTQEVTQFARQLNAPMLEKRARGELAEGTDARQVIQAVSAPLYYAFLASGEPLTEELADRAADAAIAAARVGVFD